MPNSANVIEIYWDNRSIDTNANWIVNGGTGKVEDVSVIDGRIDVNGKKTKELF